MLILVAIVSLPMAWRYSPQYWVQERHDFMGQYCEPWYGTYPEIADRSANFPTVLQSLGEERVLLLKVDKDHMDEAQRLFPEAEIYGIATRKIVEQNTGISRFRYPVETYVHPTNPPQPYLQSTLWWIGPLIVTVVVASIGIPSLLQKSRRTKSVTTNSLENDSQLGNSESPNQKPSNEHSPINPGT
jgi:hypothetical protein